jgi:hypothetical protein
MKASITFGAPVAVDIDAFTRSKVPHQRHLGVSLGRRHRFGQALLVHSAAEHVLVQHAGGDVGETGRRAAPVP